MYSVAVLLMELMVHDIRTDRTSEYEKIIKKLND